MSTRAIVDMSSSSVSGCSESLSESEKLELKGGGEEVGEFLCTQESA